MPGSNPIFRPNIKTLIQRLYPRKDCRILDVGAGEGTYSDLLRDSVAIIDAIEVHEPYIEKFDLASKYNTVYIADCRDFDYSEKWYDVIIFGDVIEHLEIADAKRVLGLANDNCDVLIVVVPFDTPQGAVDGVEWEKHLQPDLNLTTMKQRYPELLLWITDLKIGVYLRQMHTYYKE